MLKTLLTLRCSFDISPRVGYGEWVLGLLPRLTRVRVGAAFVVFEILIGCLSAVAGTPASQAGELALAGKMAKSIIIYRDTYGVPHVYALTDPEAVFGFVYAQAEDNFWQIEDGYLRAVGRASEAHGEKTLSEDLIIHALKIPSRAKEQYQEANPRIKEICDATALALNYYVVRHPQVKPRVIHHFESWQVMAYVLYELYEQYVIGSTGRFLNVPRSQANSQAGSSEPIGTPGSNMWAISREKSASGRAMLLINPHVFFYGPTQFYEGHLHSAEGWNLSGACPPGFPFPTLGHNGYLGWSHTVNIPSIVTFYVEKFDDPKNVNAYKYGDGYRAATEWTEIVTVKSDVGLIAETCRFRSTHHGPVVGSVGGNPLTIRMAKFEEGGALQEWYEMGKARTLKGFKRAMSKLAIPMFNTAYADRDGNIFYVYNAAIARRSDKFNWAAPVDGSTAETEWGEYFKFEQLPQITNPSSGFLQNCNSTPFTTSTTGNPYKKDYPSYMVQEQDSARAEMSRRILSSGRKFTFDQWTRAAFDTTEITAETQIPRIVEEWKKLKEAEQTRAAALADVIAELEGWDHISRTDSTTMTVYVSWAEAFYYRYSRDKQAWPRIRALEEIIKTLESKWGRWRVPWGDVNRLQRNHTGGDEPFSDAHLSLPVRGGPGWLGNIFTFEARPGPSQKRRYGVLGNSYVSVVEFGPRIKARSLLVFGESANPASSHYFDQAPLYSEGRPKPAWFTLSEIKSHLETAYHPGEDKPSKHR